MKSTPRGAAIPNENDKLEGRRFQHWRGRGVVKDIDLLADALVASDADLFSQDGGLVWLVDGKLIGVTPAILRDIFARYIVTKGLRNAGTAEEPIWKVIFKPYEFPLVADSTQEPSELVLHVLLGLTQRGSGLESIVPLQERVP